MNKTYIEAFNRQTEGLIGLNVGLASVCSICRANYEYDSPDAMREDLENGDLFDEGGFSRVFCGSCGSEISGDRYAAHAWIDDEREILVHLNVCVDCLRYIANGDIPEQWEWADTLETMSKHTPGEWTAERELNARGVAAETTGKSGVEIHANGYHIGTWIDNEWDGHCPNADFIVCAVNNHAALLAACKAALALLEQSNKIDWDDEVTPLLRAATEKAALSKLGLGE